MAGRDTRLALTDAADQLQKQAASAASEFFSPKDVADSAMAIPGKLIGVAAKAHGAYSGFVKALDDPSTRSSILGGAKPAQAASAPNPVKTAVTAKSPAPVPAPSQPNPVVPAVKPTPAAPAVTSTASGTPPVDQTAAALQQAKARTPAPASPPAPAAGGVAPASGSATALGLSPDPSKATALPAIPSVAPAATPAPAAPPAGAPATPQPSSDVFKIDVTKNFNWQQYRSQFNQFKQGRDQAGMGGAQAPLEREFASQVISELERHYKALWDAGKKDEARNIAIKRQDMTNYYNKQEQQFAMQERRRQTQASNPNSDFNVQNRRAESAAIKKGLVTDSAKRMDAEALDARNTAATSSEPFLPRGENQSSIEDRDNPAAIAAEQKVRNSYMKRGDGVMVKKVRDMGSMAMVNGEVYSWAELAAMKPDDKRLAGADLSQFQDKLSPEALGKQEVATTRAKALGKARGENMAASVQQIEDNLIKRIEDRNRGIPVTSAQRQEAHRQAVQMGANDDNAQTDSLGRLSATDPEAASKANSKRYGVSEAAPLPVATAQGGGAPISTQGASSTTAGATPAAPRATGLPPVTDPELQKNIDKAVVKATDAKAAPAPVAEGFSDAVASGHDGERILQDVPTSTQGDPDLERAEKQKALDAESSSKESAEYREDIDREAKIRKKESKASLDKESQLTSVGNIKPFNTHVYGQAPRSPSGVGGYNPDLASLQDGGSAGGKKSHGGFNVEKLMKYLPSLMKAFGFGGGEAETAEKAPALEPLQPQATNGMGAGNNTSAGIPAPQKFNGRIPQSTAAVKQPAATAQAKPATGMSSAVEAASPAPTPGLPKNGSLDSDAKDAGVEVPKPLPKKEADPSGVREEKPNGLLVEPPSVGNDTARPTGAGDTPVDWPTVSGRGRASPSITDNPFKAASLVDDAGYIEDPKELLSKKLASLMRAPGGGGGVSALSPKAPRAGRKMIPAGSNAISTVHDSSSPSSRV